MWSIAIYVVHDDGSETCLAVKTAGIDADALTEWSERVTLENCERRLRVEVSNGEMTWDGVREPTILKEN